MSYFGGSQFIGINDAIRWAESKSRDSKILRKVLANDAARFMVNELKINVHVWKPGKPRKKPHMRDVIKMEPAGDNALVSVPTNYAQIENDRPGTKSGGQGEKIHYDRHNFADKSYQTTMTEYTSKIRVKYDDFFNRK